MIPLRESLDKLEQQGSQEKKQDEGAAEEHSIDLDGANFQLRVPIFIPRRTACETLQSIIQAHLEKTLEKKRAVDAQKKELWRLFGLFFVFLAILFSGVIQSSKIQCKHSWAPIAICFLGHAMFYVSMAQTLKCINGFKYQRCCHKLTLGVATQKLKRIKASSADVIREEDFEVRYQEPDDEYVGKFKRKWIMFTLFLGLTMAVVISSFAAILCS